MSAQLAGLPKMISTPEIRVDCSDETKFELVKRVADRLRKTHTIIEVDGVRVVFKDGWGLLRASNTQPVLVMRFEASSQEALDQHRREIESVLQEVKAAVA